MMSRTWVKGAVALVCAATLACATTRQDASGSGDERLDESTRPDTEGAASAKAEKSCGEAGGELVLIDARSGDLVSCAMVTLLRDAEGCTPQEGAECPTEQVMKGRTSSVGELKLPDPSLLNAKLWAVAEGYVQSPRDPGPAAKGKPAEIEMIPADGFLLKFVDAEGNYLPGVSVSFKQGGEVIAQMKTNELANVYFPTRTPFAGEQVVIEADGFQPLTISGLQDLGSDGNTVTLQR